MPSDECPPKPRSRKIYVLWSTALTLLLALGLFCWLVVVPVVQLRTADCGTKPKSRMSDCQFAVSNSRNRSRLLTSKQVRRMPG